MTWPFDDPPHVVVFTTKSIAFRQRPVLLVTHDEEDGAWQFLPREGAGCDEQPETELGGLGNENVKTRALNTDRYAAQGKRVRPHAAALERRPRFRKHCGTHARRTQQGQKSGHGLPAAGRPCPS